MNKMADIKAAEKSALVDPFGRQINYLRLSVTDRCDFRCTYCMAENMTFLPRADLLTLEELDRLCTAFVERGVRKLRITGGEPLVRKGIMTLFESLGRHLNTGALDELTLTTNGSQLPKYAKALYAAGVRRVNISLDTLDAARFTRLTRWGKLEHPLNGMKAALEAGLKVKLNSVLMRGENEDEVEDLIRFAHGHGADITFIETMPLGAVDHERGDVYLPAHDVQAALPFTLSPLDYKTGGPARYFACEETGGRVGFITPMSDNFCAGCNRMRVTCTGQIYMCLGHDTHIDLRAALRADTSNAALNAALDSALAAKPERHSFEIAKSGGKTVPSVDRHMSVTGG